MAARQDLFAVIEHDPTQGGDCYVLITRDRQRAAQRKRDIETNHSLGIRRTARLVHPPQYVVDVYVLAGNRIDP